MVVGKGGQDPHISAPRLPAIDPDHQDLPLSKLHCKGRPYPHLHPLPSSSQLPAAALPTLPFN